VGIYPKIRKNKCPAAFERMGGDEEGKDDIDTQGEVNREMASGNAGSETNFPPYKARRG